MIVEFSVVPLGMGQSISEYVAKAVSIVVDSGLPYKLTAMGTIIEGDWDQVMDVIKRCHNSVMDASGRVITKISIDDRKNASKNRMKEKIESVEKHLKMKLNT